MRMASHVQDTGKSWCRTIDATHNLYTASVYHTEYPTNDRSEMQIFWRSRLLSYALCSSEQCCRSTVI